MYQNLSDSFFFSLIYTSYFENMHTSFYVGRFYSFKQRIYYISSFSWWVIRIALKMEVVLQKPCNHSRRKLIMFAYLVVGSNFIGRANEICYRNALIILIEMLSSLFIFIVSWRKRFSLCRRILNTRSQNLSHIVFLFVDYLRKQH